MASTLTPHQKDIVEAREVIAGYLAELAKNPKTPIERRHAIGEFAKRYGHDVDALMHNLQVLIDARELVKSKAASDVATAEAAVRAAQAEASKLKERAATIVREAEREAEKVKAARNKLDVAQARLDTAAGRKVKAEVGTAAAGFDNKILQSAFAQIAK